MAWPARTPTKRRTPGSHRGFQGFKDCHAHRHWNSPSYRAAAGFTVYTLDDAAGSRVTPARRPSQTGLEIGRKSGAEGARTPDLCNANAALSQLSYSPGTVTGTVITSKKRAPLLLARGRSGNMVKVAARAPVSSGDDGLCLPIAGTFNRCHAFRFCYELSNHSHRRRAARPER